MPNNQRYKLINNIQLTYLPHKHKTNKTNKRTPKRHKLHIRKCEHVHTLRKHTVKAALLIIYLCIVILSRANRLVNGISFMVLVSLSLFVVQKGFGMQMANVYIIKWMCWLTTTIISEHSIFQTENVRGAFSDNHFSLEGLPNNLENYPAPQTCVCRLHNGFKHLQVQLNSLQKHTSEAFKRVSDQFLFSKNKQQTISQTISGALKSLSE